MGFRPDVVNSDHSLCYQAEKEVEKVKTLWAKSSEKSFHEGSNNLT